MKRKFLKAFVLFVIFAIAVSAVAMAATSNVTLTRTSYYVRSNDCLGNTADVFFNCKDDSSTVCNFKLVARKSTTETFYYYDMNLNPSRYYGDSNCTGYYNWYTYIQPVNPGPSGVGGSANANLRTW